MYESHFGFNGSPFQLNPDPAFYFSSRGHSNALAYLKFGAHQGEGFIVVTGEIGAGKTTLVRTLLEGLNPDQVVAAQVVSTQLESSELLHSILLAFGVASNRTSKAHLIATLESFLTVLASKGRRALLIVDEAQNLRHEAVEELRMLSNFQLGKYGLLQSFLVGQPELRSLLQSKSMEQLRQRVIASCHLGPLDAAETRAYVEHRLRRVGWKGSSPEFAGGALDRVHHWTDGVPRRINRLCNRLLLGTFLANARIVTPSMVDETALELKSEIGEGSSGSPAPLLAADPGPAPSATPPAASADLGTTDTPSSAAPPDLVEPVPQHQAQEQAPLRSAASVDIAPPPDSHPEIVAREPVVVPHVPPLAEDASASRASGVPTVPPVVRRAHESAELSRPLLCLVDSASDYLKAGVLAEVFRGFPRLPRIVAVHPGVESDLGLNDLSELRMPLPALGVHLGISPDSFAPQTSKLSEAFDALLSEFDPCAIMVLGSSDADLACSLLARKRGIHLLRAGSGKRDSHRASNSEMNAVLIERIANILYTDSTESFYALYREGIRLDCVQSVGCLTREVLDIAAANARGVSAPSTSLSDLDPSLFAGSFGLITVDPRIGFTQSASLSTAVELFCELSRELPLVWMMRPESLRFMEYSNNAKKIDASQLTLIETTGVRQALALLRAAKCLIGRDEGAWLAEAKALAIPSLVLTPASSLEAPGCAEESVTLAMAGGSGRTRFVRMLESPGSAIQSPEYWDGGTASRIAGHLVGWLSKLGRESAPKATAAPELVHT
ncbi:MAG: XrtA/PEP-CTERM system-associated ATPase [Burkholderiaceae bacterium]